MHSKPKNVVRTSSDGHCGSVILRNLAVIKKIDEVKMIGSKSMNCYTNSLITQTGKAPCAPTHTH